MKTVIILGCALTAKEEADEELKARCRGAAERFRGARFFCSGGITQGHTRSEASVMEALLKAYGIPAEQIVLEEESRNTMENLRNCRDMGAFKGETEIVTSGYHVLRVRLTLYRLHLHAQVTGVHAGSFGKALQEAFFLADLLIGWQDEGRTRPAWTYRLFNGLFGTHREADR